MSVEVAIICDVCGALVQAEKTAARARWAVKDQGGKVSLAGGLDVCPDCVSDPAWRSRLDRWRRDLNA